MQLNQDIINHVFSFLPIRNTEYDKYIILMKVELHQNILYRKWISIYKKKYSTNPTNPDYYLDWLENDVTRWCNNDIPTLFEFTPKLINILNRICPKPFNRLYDNLLTHNKIHNYFSTFTHQELHDINIFLTTINTQDSF